MVERRDKYSDLSTKPLRVGTNNSFVRTLLEFLEQILAFNSADIDTDASVTSSREVWSCPLVFRGTAVDLFFRIPHIDDKLYYINYQLLAPSPKLAPIPSIWWSLVPYELILVPKRRCSYNIQRIRAKPTKVRF